MVIDVCVRALVGSFIQISERGRLPSVHEDAHHIGMRYIYRICRHSGWTLRRVPSATSGGNVHVRCSILRLRIMIDNDYVNIID